MDINDLPLMAQTTYAELLDLSGVHAFESAVEEPGTFSAKTVKGSKYWYFRPKRHLGADSPQRYVGRETVELLERIAQHRQAKRDQSAQRALVRSLVHAYGLPAPLPAAAQVVEGLARGGVFRLRGVLVGTMAYQTYAAMLGVRLKGALDVDVGEFLSVSIAVPDQTDSMKKVLQAIDPTFRKIPTLGRSAPTRYISRQRLRVDFLVPNQGADSDEPLYLPALKTAAEPLRFLDFLIYEPVQAVLLHGGGVAVTVPAPERFAVHKLILSRRRKSSVAKAEKDLRQATVLLQLLLQKRPEDLQRVWAEAVQRGPSWRELLQGGIAQLPASLQESLKASGLFRGSGEPRSRHRP